MRILVAAMMFQFAAFAGAAHAADLTSDSARAVVQASEDAWKRMDLDASQELHSADCMATDDEPDADGKLVTTTSNCSGTFVTGRKSLREMQAIGGQIHYDSTIKTARLQGDRAIVSLHAVVTMSGNGTARRVEYDQDETVQSRGGKLLITATQSKTTREVVDGKRVY